jgi:hypothetical protein
VLWHLGYTTGASATAFTQSYQAFQGAAFQQEPSYRVKGVLTDGFDSTTKSLRTLFPGARLGTCLRHALNKLPKKLAAIPSPLRKALRSKFHTPRLVMVSFTYMRSEADCVLRTSHRGLSSSPR